MAARETDNQNFPFRENVFFLPNDKIYFRLQMHTRIEVGIKQCDQIGLSLKYLGNNYRYKIFGYFLYYFEKHHTYIK